MVERKQENGVFFAEISAQLGEDSISLDQGGPRGYVGNTEAAEGEGAALTEHTV